MRSSFTRSDRTHAHAPQSHFPSADATVDRVVAAAGPAVATIVDRALPTPHLLKVLAGEVRKATNQPKAVPHPELADADAFWRQAAFPQAASLVRQLRALLVEVATELGPVVEASKPDFERWLRSVVVIETSARRTDPAAARARVIDLIAARCGELHAIVLRMALVVPEGGAIDELRAGLAQGRRKQAEALAAANSVTVDVADLMLRHESPHRHQDLLLDAFELALATLRSDVEAMVTQLTAPIFGLGEQLVRTYGEMVLELDTLGVEAPLLRS